MTEASTQTQEPVSAPAPSSEPTTIPSTDGKEALVGGQAPNSAAPPTEAKPAEVAAPLTMASFTLPEGTQVDEASAGTFLSILNDRTLSPEVMGQKLIDLQLSSNKAAEEARSAAWDDVQKQWQSETKAAYKTPQEYDAAIATANRVATEFGGTDFNAALALTGLGNHPALVSFLNRIAPRLLEAGPVAPGNPGGRVPTAAELLYPTMNQGK